MSLGDLSLRDMGRLERSTSGLKGKKLARKGPTRPHISAGTELKADKNLNKI